jgi:hypothetical protein
MSGQGPRGAGWTRRGKELGRAVAGPTRGVSRPSARSRPSRRRRARPTTIRARVERHAATQAHGGRLGLPLQGLTLPHGSGRFPQAVTRPGPPRSASRRSGRQAQGRRPALNHHRLIRALLFLACTAELTGGAPANAMAPGTPQESGACPPGLRGGRGDGSSETGRLPQLSLHRQCNERWRMRLSPRLLAGHGDGLAYRRPSARRSPHQGDTHTKRVLKRALVRPSG